MAAPTMYDTLFYANVTAVATLLLVGRLLRGSGGGNDSGVAAAEGDEGLKWRYMGVFLLYKLADWMQGPYFHEMYSKKVDGQDQVARLFLIGFLAAMVANLFAGSFVDRYGRKTASLGFAVCFATCAATSQSDDYNVLLAGRVVGGVATSLLYTAPEAWLMGECGRLGLSGRYIGDFFGWVYFLDGSIAILAGWASGALVQYSAATTGTEDVTYPFIASGVVVLVAALLALAMWGENYPATGAGDKKSAEEEEEEEKGASALSTLLSSPRLIAVGVMQACFEGSMYVFVLNWGKALTEVAADAVPYGTVFSCFMCCSMVGSTLGGILNLRPTQQLAVAAVVGIVGLAPTLATQDVLYRCVGLCVYEASIGLYFPAMGTLRAGVLPDAHRASIMNYYRVPLNSLVVAAMLYYEQLGVFGGMSVVAASLGVVAALAASMHVIGDEATKSKPE